MPPFFQSAVLTPGLLRAFAHPGPAPCSCTPDPTRLPSSVPAVSSAQLPSLSALPMQPASWSLWPWALSLTALFLSPPCPVLTRRCCVRAENQLIPHHIPDCWPRRAQVGAAHTPAEDWLPGTLEGTLGDKTKILPNSVCEQKHS